MVSPNVALLVQAQQLPPPTTRGRTYQQQMECAIPILATAAARLSAGKTAAMKKHGLSLDNATDTHRLGSHFFRSTATKANYDGKLKQLRSFLTNLGDYESLLILEDKKIPYCPAINVESLVLFIRYKRNSTTEKLTNVSDHPVTDVNGTVITCKQSWNNPKIVDSLTAAVVILHKQRYNDSPYQEPCTQCLALPIADQHKGCTFHPSSPRLRRTGNPCYAAVYQDCAKQLRFDGIAYQPEGANFLSPKDIRVAQKYLCNTGEITDLQMYVMILLGIKCFLRHKEYAKICIHHMQKVEKLYVIDKNGTIQALCLEVRGKSDKQRVQLLIWKDDENPVFCPVRFLLLYIKVSGIKSGYLFPTEYELKHPPQNGHFVTYLDYNLFSHRLSDMCHGQLNRDDRVGCHTFRKTAYLFAIWGGGKTNATIMLSARHTTEGAASVYRKDAETLLQLLSIHQDPDQFVSSWKPIYIQSVSCYQQLNLPSQQFIKPIHTMAVDFVVNDLCVPENSRDSDQISSLVSKAVAFKTVIATSVAIQTSIEQNVPPSKQQELLHLYGTGFREARQEGRQEVSAQQGAALSQQTAVVFQNEEVTPRNSSIHNNQHQSQSFPTGRRSNNLVGRLKVRTTHCPKAKLQLMLDIRREMVDGNINSGDVTVAAKTWLFKQLMPVTRCFHNHCSSDVSTFFRKCPIFKPSDFLCNGLETEPCKLDAP